MISCSTRVRAAFVCGALIHLCSCNTPSHDEASLPVPAIKGEVRLEPGSPKLAALTIDSVIARRERTIATLPARVAVDENHTVHLLSPVTGRIAALYAEPGDHVKSGQALAQVISADVAQANSDFVKATAQVKVVDAALARATDLYEHHVIAQRELQQSQADVAQAKAEEMRAQDRTAQLGLQQSASHASFVLRSPIDGMVVERSSSPGSEVRPDGTLPLFTISSMQHVWLTTRVNQRDLSSIRNGIRLIFTTDAVPGRSFIAQISYVSAVLDPVTRTGTARAVIDNADGALRPEMFGEARIVTADASATPVIATRALITSGLETIVYVERAPGIFVRRVVRVGDDDGTWSTIVSGLQIGERVVTDGSLLLDAEFNRGS